MPRRPPEPLPTIWRVPDHFGRVVERVPAELDPPKRTGRRWIDPRGALDAIIFRLRSGCQWNGLPKEFPDHSEVSRAAISRERSAAADLPPAGPALTSLRRPQPMAAPLSAASPAPG